MAVFVIGSDGIPVMPCTPKRARLLLERKKAYVVKIKPFTIKLKDRSSDTCEMQNLQVKIDPGARTTGVAVVRENVDNPKVITIIHKMELEHRGQEIVGAMQTRSMYRKSRRQRNIRHRKCRNLNRKRNTEWLPPSKSSVEKSILNWGIRLTRLAPIASFVLEDVKFDTQLMQDPSLVSTDYQYGTLHGTEIREYLFAKWDRKCMYCDKDASHFLEVEHIVPKSRGGSNRISNLGLACHVCNQKKGSTDIEKFLSHDLKRMFKIKSQLRDTLKDASVMNAIRNRLFTDLLKLGLPVATGTGGQTKYNRKRFNIFKTHANDAACVGDVAMVLHASKRLTHNGVKCMGRGRHQRTISDKFGFPKAYLMKTKRVFGFATGDLVRITPKVGNPFIRRITVRTNGGFGYFNKGTAACLNGRQINIAKGITHARCSLVQKVDGYNYYTKIYQQAC